VTITATRQRTDIAEEPVAQVSADRLHLDVALIDDDVRRHSVRGRNHLPYPRNATTTLH
jgi:hypothetical protein